MTIDDYRFGRMVVNGTAYTEDIILLPEGVRPGWWRKAGHRLCKADLEDALAAEPDVLVVGTGASARMAIPDDVRRAIEERGVELRAAPTDEAVRLYRQADDANRLVAAFHLTC
jgi:hypothetical protein